MDRQAGKTDSLPLNFPRTFLPERRLLAQLLPFAARYGSGDKESIGAETDIPTGKSSGKVEPMIRYAQGMGMVMAEKESGNWRLSLTPLGQVILREDAFLSEPLTLWLLHLLLCRRGGLGTPRVGVADAWFTLFGEGDYRLGNRFAQEAYLTFLTDRHGDKGHLKALAGIVLRSYLEDSSFGSITALQEEKSETEQFFIRQSAPVEKIFFPAYAAYLYLVWDELFAGETQLALDDFAKQTRCFAVLGWDEAKVACWLDWMVDKGVIQIDRYTGAAMLLRLQETEQVVAGIYSELI